MNKQLTALAALAIGLTAAAMPFSVANKTQLHPENATGFKATTIEVPAQTAKAPARAESNPDEMYYSLAGMPYTALAFNGQTLGSQVAMAFQMDPSFLSGLENGKITSISFWTGSESDVEVNKIKKATVFITDNLSSGTYLYTQVCSDITSEAFAKVDVALNEAFVIPEGKEIYVGVYMAVSGENSCAITVDYKAHSNDYGGWVASRNNGLSKWSWENIAAYYGFVTLGATITATNLPKNAVSVDIVDGQPVAYANSPFDFSFRLTNQGANKVNNITVSYGIEGEQTYTEVLNAEGDWAFAQSIVSSVTNMTGKVPTKLSKLTLSVTEVNGVANTHAKMSGGYDVTIVSPEYQLTRNAVIEEFTSIHCQYCPVGYTTMEMIRENFTSGNIIPVAVHVDFGSKDPMTAASYGNVYNNYGYSQGLPSTVINRTYECYPNYETLAETALMVSELPGVGHVDATATIDTETKTLTVNTTTSFAFDYAEGDKNFILAYGITEDGLGPYAQKNGYSGYSSPVLGGWESLGSSVSLIFNDVARQLDRYSGITGSIPAEIKAGETYSYTHDVKLLSTIKDLNKIHLVVYLINRTNGCIENACMVNANAIGGLDGIDEITAIPDAPVEYFNLQGVRVSNPSKGLYIRRQGNKTTKVIL